MMRIFPGCAAVCLVIGLIVSGERVVLADPINGLPIVSYDAFDYGFRGPDRLDAGMVNLQVVDTGQQPHQMQLVRLEGGHTAAEFAAAIKAEPKRFPVWGRLVGGPNGVVPGSRASTIQKLVPGDHVLVCWLPDHTGAPHLTLGMTKSVTVVAGTPKPAPEIVPDVTITLADFSYTLSKPITAGTRTINVVNQGQQVHETLVVQLPRKGLAKAYGEALTPGKPAAGSPPGKPIGGVVGLAPGDHALFQMAFTSGHYGLLCLFPDHETGQPHFEKGMTLEFDVK
jgi:uncharacterized cupredoxin-like copper-binding protein